MSAHIFLISAEEWQTVWLLIWPASSPHVDVKVLHFMPFISQEGPKLEIYDTILLHLWPTFNTYSCLHRWNYP